MDAILLDAALNLPPEDRRELMERLSDSLEADGFELSPEQEAELDRREAAIEAGHSKARPWREVMAEIRARHSH